MNERECERTKRTKRISERASERARSALVESERRLNRLLPVHFCLCRPARRRSSPLPPPLPLLSPASPRLHDSRYTTVSTIARNPPPPRRSSVRSTLPPPRHPVYLLSLSRLSRALLLLSRRRPSLLSSPPPFHAFEVGSAILSILRGVKRATQPYHHPAAPRFRFGRPGEGAPFARSLSVFMHVCMYVCMYVRVHCVL